MELMDWPRLSSLQRLGMLFCLVTHNVLSKVFAKSTGEVYFSDANRIRYVNSTNYVVTLAGSGSSTCCAYVGGSSGDGSNSLKSVVITGSTTTDSGFVNVLGFGDTLYFTDA